MARFSPAAGALVSGFERGGKAGPVAAYVDGVRGNTEGMPRSGAAPVAVRDAMQPGASHFWLILA